MKTKLAFIFCIISNIVLAQTPGNFKPGTGAPSANAVNTALANKQDLIYNIVDTFKQVNDGSDDSPSIQRAINAACGSVFPVIKFKSHHYLLNSQINQSCYVNWVGEGFREQNNNSNSPGTWLTIGSYFINNLTPPILINDGSEGSTIDGFGFEEPGQTAPPVPLNSNGNITGWQPSTWTPTAYPQIIMINPSPGITVKNIMLNGITQGIVCAGSGRCQFDNIRGQVFGYALNFQAAYDITRVNNIHIWPYWSSADPVMAYTQSNTAGIISYRNDTPFWDKLFFFGIQNGILFLHEGYGETTGAAIGTISCDFVQHCINVGAGTTGITMQIANLRSFSQKWDTITSHSVSMLPGSDAINVDGVLVAQISNMENFGSDDAVVRFTNTTSSSNIHVDSMYAHIQLMSSNSNIIKFPTSGSNTISTNIFLLSGTSPNGLTLTNTNSGQTGVGNATSLTYSQVH